jgi:imidazoleglycerol-phosphate dehydratase
MSDAKRHARVERKTKETDVAIHLDVDGTGSSKVSTPIPFFSHMLEAWSKHGLMDLTVEATGDVEVDIHHTVEDVGIVLGQAIEKAVGDKRGIQRYGWAIVPMDESLAQVAVDLSGRPAFVFNVTFTGPTIGDFQTELVEEFLKSLSANARMNLHVAVPYGTNNHHIAEAIFKATAKALRQAVSRDPRNDDLPSTKGSLAG